MGNSNCGCVSRKVGGKRVKRGGMGCNKTRKHRVNKKKVNGGCSSCGCELMSGGYKYDRRSSVEAVKRLKKRVSKNTKNTKSKSKKNKKKHKKTKRKLRK